MSEQIYRFIKFLEQKEGRTPPAFSVIKFGEENEITENVQIAAVEQNGQTIRFIENPSEDVQLAAVESSNLAIFGIENPTPKVLKILYFKLMKRYGSIPRDFEKYFK
jgi:hypothetical protein